MKHYEIMVAPFNTYSWLPDFAEAEYFEQDSNTLKYLYKYALSSVKARMPFENLCMVCKVDGHECGRFLFIS